MLRRLIFTAARSAVKEYLKAPGAVPLNGPPSTPAVTGPLVVRPKISTLRQMLNATPILVVAFIGSIVLRRGLAGLLLSAALGFVLMGLLVTLRKRTSISVNATEISRTGILGRRRVRPLSDVAKVFIASIRSGRRAVQNAFVLDSEGRSIIRMPATSWAPDDIARVIGAVGVRPVRLDKPVTPQNLAQALPHALPWYERLPRWVQLATVVVLVAATVVIVAVTS